MRANAVTVAILAFLIIAALVRLEAQAPQQGAAGGGRGAAITTGYPQRPPADPVVVERGRMLYSINCAFCHG